MSLCLPRRKILIRVDPHASVAENLEFMTFANLLLEKKNSIAYLTVNRPKVLNALNIATGAELGTA